MSQVAHEAGLRGLGSCLDQGAQREDEFMGFPSTERPGVRTSRKSLRDEKNYFQSSGPRRAGAHRFGRGARALRVVLRGLCEAFPGSLGLASHDLPGSRRRALIFNMRALEREDSMDFRVPALRGGC